MRVSECERERVGRGVMEGKGVAGGCLGVAGFSLASCHRLQTRRFLHLHGTDHSLRYPLKLSTGGC
jgi:hypothetical protein